MFTPSTSLLGTVDVNENFSYTITYSSSVTDPETGLTTETTTPVTITAASGQQSVLNNVTISGNTISGYFASAVFDQVRIEYEADNSTRFVTIDSSVTSDVWAEVDTRTDVGHIYLYHPDPRSTITVSFNAQAGSASQTYTIIVRQPSYSIGRDELIARV